MEAWMALAAAGLSLAVLGLAAHLLGADSRDWLADDHGTVEHGGIQS